MKKGKKWGEIIVPWVKDHESTVWVSRASGYPTMVLSNWLSQQCNCQLFGNMKEGFI
jgi:hypothetical protein